MLQIENLQGPEEIQTASRSLLYQFLARAFRFPDKAFYEDIQTGAFHAELLRICAGLPYEMPVTNGSGLEPVSVNYENFEAEYIRIFDVGTGGPPCPLYGGEYQGGRMKVMEELVRFYNHFGLTLSQQQRELPDHVTVELEFMHFLTFKETLALHHRQDRSPYLRAQRDFVARHLGKWLPLLARRLQAQKPVLSVAEGALPFFAGLVALAGEFLQRERDYLVVALEGLNG